jgi:ketosteroid isomerase-like protein
MELVERYMEAFRRSDHEAALACLSPDIEWRIHGVRTTHGKAEFDDEIENPAFEGSPVLTLDRTIETGDTIIATGMGVGRLRAAGTFEFAFCDIFVFRDRLISQVESYVVPLA